MEIDFAAGKSKCVTGYFIKILLINTLVEDYFYYEYCVYLTSQEGMLPDGV